MAAYKIEIEFSPNWTENEKTFLNNAANRWMQIVSSSPPSVRLNNGQLVSGLLVRADVVPGAAGGSFAFSGPDENRPASANYLPASATVQLERADLDALRYSGRLEEVLFHELGHGMGFGINWPLKGLLQGAGIDPHFVGAKGQAAYGDLRGTGPQPVPVEGGGGTGVSTIHWRESSFVNEIMSPYIPANLNPLSRLTLASMIDLGYDINLAQAEPYALPNHNLFDKKLESDTPTYRVRPTTPTILPEESLIKVSARKPRFKPVELADAQPDPAVRRKRRSGRKAAITPIETA